MTSPQVLVARGHPERAIGLVLLTLGVSTMLGWLLKHPVLFKLAPGFLPMVFNTGAGFALCGLALCLSGLPTPGRQVQWAICGVVAFFTAATLFEIGSDRSLGIDLSSLHTWYDYGNTRPGRMAPNTALALLLIGVAIPLSNAVKNRSVAAATMGLTFAVMTIGLVGLVGYLMSPDLLFGWARSARMAVQTAVGVIVASVGLWFTWSRSDWYQSERFFDEGTKIRFLSAAVVVVVTITAGLSGFVLLQHSFQMSLEARLSTSNQNRGPWLRAVINGLSSSSANAARAAGLATAGGSAGIGNGAANLQAAAEELLRMGFRSVSYKDAAGTLLASYGSASDPVDFDAPLDAKGSAALIWRGELRVRTRHPLMPVAGTPLPATTVEIESDASHLRPLLFEVGRLGSTAQVTACQRKADTLLCLPNALSPGLFTLPVHKPPQTALPMQRALDEAGPGTAHGLDYRGRSVIAAYTTLAPGLGFVIEQDAVEAYAPIRRALAIGAPVIVLLAIAGALAMYSQLNPLVRRMRRSERASALALARNLAVREAVTDGILTLDEHGRIESSNAAANTMMGWRPGELDGLEIFALLPERSRAQHKADYALAVAGDDAGLLQLRCTELEAARRDGTEFPIELTLNPIPDLPEKLFVAVIRDITARRMAEDVLSRMAKFDALTGLPNRALFHDRLRTAVERAGRSGHSLGLMFLDLDGFKAINDQHGHAAGDELLRQAAKRLAAIVRKTDTVARLAGDEFTMILEDLKKGADDARHVADKAVAAMQKSFEVEGQNLRVTVSVGIVVYDPRVEGAVDMAELLKRADASMYQVKRGGKNGFAFAQQPRPENEASGTRV